MTLSGCLLSFLSAHVVRVEDDLEGYAKLQAEIEAGSTVTLCSYSGYMAYNCTYIIEGHVITSTIDVWQHFGLLRHIFDPVIVQLPDDVRELKVTFDAGDGPQPASVLLSRSIAISPTASLEAEPGMLLAILEFPAAVNQTITGTTPLEGKPFDLKMSFEVDHPKGAPAKPLEIKALYAVRIDVANHIFYIPTLPCVTSFDEVTPLVIPVADTPQTLIPQATELIGSAAEPCNREFFNFDVLVLAPLTYDYLPMVRAE